MAQSKVAERKVAEHKVAWRPRRGMGDCDGKGFVPCGEGYLPGAGRRRKARPPGAAVATAAALQRCRSCGT